MFSASTTELYFPKPHNRVITNTIKFTNNTSVDAVIKMRTTSREKFHVRPRIFAIRRGEVVEVSVSSRILPADLPEIADKGDECHAVIHQFSPTSSSSASDSGVFSTPEALQLAWDAGQHLGRVVLRCHVSEPPAGHTLTFASASADQQKTANGFRSKSASLVRIEGGGDLNGSGSNFFPPHQQQHTRGPSDATSASNSGKPPLTGGGGGQQQHGRTLSSNQIAAANNNTANTNSTTSVRNPNSAHNQFQRDQDVQQYQTSSSKHSFNGATLERLSQSMQRHETALDRTVGQLNSLRETAKVAATNVEAQVLARENQVANNNSSSGSSNIDVHGRVKRVPLSVAVFFMVLAFLAGVLMKQSAYQHHLDAGSFVEPK